MALRKLMRIQIATSCPRQISPVVLGSRHLRPAQVACRVAQDGEISVSEAAAIAFNNNEAFKAVFAEALARNGGTGALTQSSKQAEDEKSGMEDVLNDTEKISELSFNRLIIMQGELNRLIEREAKQIERIVFALDKTKSDQAYYNTLQAMLNKDGSILHSNQQSMSAMEELLYTALDSAKTLHGRLSALLAEVDKALEREGQQVERLKFATKKAHDDEAYYRSLRMMLEEGAE